MKKSWLVGAGIVVVLVIVVWLAYLQRDAGITGEVVVTSTYMDVSSREALALINDNPDIAIIDVSPFYNDGHIPGATWYYYGDGSLEEAIPDFDPMWTYLVYCHFDGPSRNGAQKLVDAGFENVYRLTDHFSGWVDEGYPVEY